MNFKSTILLLWHCMRSQILKLNILYKSNIFIDWMKLKASVPIMCIFTVLVQAAVSTQLHMAIATVPLHCCQILLLVLVHTIGASHD